MLAGSQEVGTVQGLPELDSIIGLAGYAWRVISVDARGKMVHVERTRGTVKPNWLGRGSAHIHKRVIQRMRQVLQEETVYAYLAPQARQRLALVRDLARRSDWLRSCVVRLEPGRFALFPWASSRISETIVHILHFLNWGVHRSNSGPYIEIVYDGDTGAVIAELRKLGPQVPALVKRLVSELREGQLWRGKYDSLAPRVLLEKAYINDVLDVPGTMLWLANCS